MRNGNLRLEISPSILLLRTLNLPSYDILPNIVLLRQVKEPSDLRRPLGTKALGEGDISQPRNVVITLLYDNHGQYGNIGANNASTDGLAFALASPPNTVAGVAVGKEKTDTVWDEDALFHRETLFIVATGNTEDIALPLVADRIGGNFLGDLLVVEDTAGSPIRHWERPDMRSKRTISFHRRCR